MVAEPAAWTSIGEILTYWDTTLVIEKLSVQWPKKYWHGNFRLLDGQAESNADRGQRDVARNSYNADGDQVAMVASSRHKGRADVRGTTWRQREVPRVKTSVLLTLLYISLHLISSSWIDKCREIEGNLGTHVNLSTTTEENERTRAGLHVPRPPPQRRCRHVFLSSPCCFASAWCRPSIATGGSSCVEVPPCSNKHCVSHASSHAHGSACSQAVVLPLPTISRTPLPVRQRNLFELFWAIFRSNARFSTYSSKNWSPRPKIAWHHTPHETGEERHCTIFVEETKEAPKAAHDTRTTETRTPTVKKMTTNQPLLSNSHPLLHCRSDPLKKHNRWDAPFLTHLLRTLPSSNPTPAEEMRWTTGTGQMASSWVSTWRKRGKAVTIGSDAWLLSAVVLVRCWMLPAGEEDGGTPLEQQQRRRKGRWRLGALCWWPRTMSNSLFRMETKKETREQEEGRGARNWEGRLDGWRRPMFNVFSYAKVNGCGVDLE